MGTVESFVDYSESLGTYSSNFIGNGGTSAGTSTARATDIGALAILSIVISECQNGEMTWTAKGGITAGLRKGERIQTNHALHPPMTPVCSTMQRRIRLLGSAEQKPSETEQSSA